MTLAVAPSVSHNDKVHCLALEASMFRQSVQPVTMMRVAFHLAARFRRPSTFAPSAIIPCYLRSSSSVSGTSSGPIALVFDTETTGKADFQKPAHDPCQPDLVQLGFILVDTSDWSRRMSMSMLVQLEDGVSIDPTAQETHGISVEDCSKFGVSRGVALDLFHLALQKADLVVAHNLSFDELVMEAAAYRERDNANVKQNGGPLPGLRRVCTMKSSTDVLKLPGRFGNYKWPSLAEAFAHFAGGKGMEDAHDAMVDAKACLAVFRGLVESGAIQLEPVESVDEFEPECGNVDASTEKDESNEERSWDISAFPQAKAGELRVTPTYHGFDVSGFTYKHKEALKALGGRWNPKSNCWSFEGHNDLVEVMRFAGFHVPSETVQEFTIHCRLKNEIAE